MKNTKIYITNTTPIGQSCLEWAQKNNYHGIIVDNMEECDILISVFYNKVLSKEFITSKTKCFNFHGGILPYYRGSGTYNWAILNEEKETGVTLHEIDSGIDHGPIIEIRKFPIEKTDTSEDLFKKAGKITFEMFKDWFDSLINMRFTTIPQDDSKAKIFSREDLQRAKDITRFARSFHVPGYEQAYYYNRSGKKIYLKW